MDKRKKKETVEKQEMETENEIHGDDIERALKEAESGSEVKEDGAGEDEEGTVVVKGEEVEEAEGGGTSAEIDGLKEELERARGEVTERQEQYLRVMAEFENFKKRVQKESIESRRYANEELVKAMLPVLDNLERALEHVDDGSDDDPLIEGVRMVQKQFLEALGKFGVSPVNALGETFDPNFHEAMMQVDTDDSPPNTVVTEITKGYLLNDRLVRPAMVGVSVNAKGSDAATDSSSDSGDAVEEREADDLKDDDASNSNETLN
jgi:molecular chaperone GrpE